LRFDDRLETALIAPDDSKSAVAGQWRQLVDILAQNPKQFSPQLVADGLRRASALMPKISATERALSVRALRGRILSPPLVQLLAADVPQVAAEAVSGARLSDHDWADMVPHLPMRARGFLRNRGDIGPLTRKALTHWSASDFLLPNPNINAVEDYVLETGSTDPTEMAIAPRSSLSRNEPVQDIRYIVNRIEQLRRERESFEAPQLPLNGGELHEPAIILDEIRFETDDLGTISWTEGAPRGAIVGVDISEPAFGGGPGPDAYGASAFRQRMPLENARMRLCGAAMIEGDWRINAMPFFDTVSGRFRGYRGIFRRPNIVENAQIRAQEQPVATDQLQQLVHELRTPLGAIIGFSEIIEQQLFGPVSAEYRALAKSIYSDAERLLAGFDDLAMAAKIDAGRFVADPGVTECSWLVERLAERLQGLSNTLSITLNLSLADPVRPFAIDTILTERIFSRLLSSVMIGCEPGESIDGRFRTEIGNAATNRFILTLPRKLCGLVEADLFEMGLTPQPSIAESPLLGLGFSLRLVRNLAQNVRGDLRLYNETLILSLPATRDGFANFRNEEQE
jgi:signal transduction histidine kinase